MKDMRPDRDPRLLSDLLRRHASDGPDAPSPASPAEVVRRNRRASRRRGRLSAIAVGAVALTVIIGPHLLPGSPVSNDASATPIGPEPVAALSEPYRCPSPGRPAAHARVLSTDAVPDGAVLARICATRGPGLVRWSAPVDALTSDVSSVADAYDGLPVAQPLPCPHGHNDTAFSITFEYADGSLVRVSAPSDGIGDCDHVALDGRDELGRSHSGALMSAYVEALQRQRAARPAAPQPQGATLRCPTTSVGAAPGLLPDGDDLGMVTGIVCQYDPTDSRTLTRSGVLSESQSLQIDRDYAARVARHLPPGASCMNPTPPDIRIIGRTAWGDVVVLSSECYVYTRTGADPSDGQAFWAPSPPVQSMIAAALHK